VSNIPFLHVPISLTISSGVLAVQSHKEQKIHMFRSYLNPTLPNNDHDRKLLRLNLNDQKNERIHEVAHATSAAPYYFRSINISGLKYLDGGLIANNPSKYAWAEANSMHLNHPSGNCPGHGSSGGVRFLVSIGTGKRTAELIKSGKIRKALSILNKGVQSITDTEEDHELMEDKVNNDDIYYRFNVEQGLEDMKLDDCRIAHNGQNATSQEIEIAVSRYLRDGAVRRRLERLAKELVQNRRQKCRQQDRRYRDLCVPGPLHSIFDDRFHDGDGDGEVLNSPVDETRSRAGSIPWPTNGAHELNTSVPEMPTPISVPELYPQSPTQGSTHGPVQPTAQSPAQSPTQGSTILNDTPFQNQQEFSQDSFSKPQTRWG